MLSLTDRPDMTLAVYCGRRTTTHKQHNNNKAYQKKNAESYELKIIISLRRSRVSVERIQFVIS